MDSVPVRQGLAAGGLLIPWFEWKASEITVRTEVCQVQVDSPRGPVLVAAARVRIVNGSASARKVELYAALVADRKTSGAGAVGTDNAGGLAMAGKLPSSRSAQSATGECSGALRFDRELRPNSPVEFGFVCPVLPGRSAARHRWTDLKQNAMADMAELNPAEGGIPQPDPGPAFYRRLRVPALFDQAASYWNRFLSRIEIRMPDPRWGESTRAILAHAGMCMNEGAPDVAVINYNVFNRDGMYIANMMQKSGLSEYSERVLDYFVSHPFNGRARPEADNPGQVLWAIHQHWLITRDSAWLRRMFPSVRKLAEMIRYYRTAPAPHWVNMKRLEFGNSLPEGERELLRPGSCDGFHPEYTEAFDIAGLRGAAELAGAAGGVAEAADWRKLADALFAAYDEKFGGRLARQYGSYCVLWPCRLYPASRGKAWEQFREKGAQSPQSWRNFPLATAHQGLFAGNRAAGHGTLDIHLAHEQIQGWYAFDEGGGSGSGTWHRARTTWTHSKEMPGENRSVAMPHGWAIAEFWLLMRDSIVFEDAGRLVLFAGVPEEWFRDPRGMSANGLATYFGPLNVNYSADARRAAVELGGAAPPDGYVLRLPPALGGDREVKPGTKRIEIRL